MQLGGDGVAVDPADRSALVVQGQLPAPVRESVAHRAQLDGPRGAQAEAAQAPVAAEEGGHAVVGGGGEQRVRVGELGDPAVLAQYHHLVAESDGLLDVVGDEQHRLVQLGLQPQQLLLEPGTHHRVDGAERLVHQQHRRVGGQGARHADALLLAAGQLERVPLGGLGREPDEFEQFGGPGAGLLAVPAEQVGDGGDVVDHLAVRKESGLLDDVADAAPQLGGLQLRDVRAVQQYSARGGLDHPVDHAQQGGLAAAGRSDQDGYPTGRDLKVQALDGDGPVGVALSGALESDHGVFPRQGAPGRRRLCRSFGRVVRWRRFQAPGRTSARVAAQLWTGGNSDQTMTCIISCP